MHSGTFGHIQERPTERSSGPGLGSFCTGASEQPCAIRRHPGQAAGAAERVRERSGTPDLVRRRLRAPADPGLRFVRPSLRCARGSSNVARRLAHIPNPRIVGRNAARVGRLAERRAADHNGLMPRPEGWTRDQQLIALRLYMGTPFGKLHGRNPDIIDLAQRIGRTANALAMKACNFASLNPAFRRTNRTGLSGASEANRAIGRIDRRFPTKSSLGRLISWHPVLRYGCRPKAIMSGA